MQQPVVPMERNQRGVSRVLKKLDASIENGNYYEAHQMYRTLYFRYNSQKKYDECLDLLYNGAIKLLQAGQESSAADLGGLLIDTLEKRNSCDNWDWEPWIERVSNVIKLLSAATVERDSLIYRAIKWSGEISGHNIGHPTMHKNIAHIFWAEGNMELARHHYLMARDGNLFGRILIRIAVDKGFPSEVDLFIAQAVLQILCIKERQVAGDTFITYARNHPQIRKERPPFKLPLLNFLHFLLCVIDMGDVNIFRALCKLYKASIRRDQAYEIYLNKIGVIYFGIAPPPSPSRGLMGGMFGDLFSRLLQGFDEDDDEGVVLTQNASHRGGGDGISELD